MAQKALIFALAVALAWSLLRPPQVVERIVEKRVEVPAPKPPEEVPKVTQVTEKKAPSAQELFRQDMRNALRQPGLEGCALGYCVLDEQGRVLVEEGADTALIPASSLKTLTTATALEKWGPQHRLQTQLRATREPQEGVLKGDLCLVGGADPMLNLPDLQAWATKLKKQGLQRVTGRVLGDGRLFRGSLFDDFWNWGDIGNGYGSAVSGLNLEHNRCTLTLIAGAAEGAPVALEEVAPEVPGIRWVNELVTGSAGSGDGVMIHGGENASRFFLRGTVPLGGAPLQVQAAISEPSLFAAHHLRLALIRAGVSVEGEAGIAEGMQAYPALLDAHFSPPLEAIVTSIHTTSDNHETECLFRLLGVEAQKSPDAVVRDHWQSRGLTFMGLRMEDGCGLARADHITPRDLARLQHLAATGPQGEVYVRSLLSQANLRWKGGAMSGVRTTAGILTLSTGQKRYFSLMLNHYAEGSAAGRFREIFLQALNGLR